MNQAVAHAPPTMLLPATKAIAHFAPARVEDFTSAARTKSIAPHARHTYRTARAQARGVAIAGELTLIALFALALAYLPSNTLRPPELQKALTVRLHAAPPRLQTPLPLRAELPPAKILHPVFVPPPTFEIAATVTPFTRATHQPPIAAIPAIPAPAAPQPGPDVLVAYQVLLRAAVQQAVLYTAAAKAAGIQGNCRIAFDFRDGRVSNLDIVLSSGSKIIDRAAIAAVAGADIPAPPVELRGRQYRFAIVVTFSLANG